MTEVDDVLQAMSSGEAVVDIDTHFARLMARMDAAGGAPLAAAAALVSAASLRGDIGIGRSELAAACDRWTGDGEGAVDRLEASPVTGDGTTITPIVRDLGRYYLYRYWDYERRLAAALRARNTDAPDAPAPDALKSLLDRRLATPGGGEVDWQRAAVALAMRRALTIVSGGPGTGKTSTMVKLLAVAVECLGAGCRIALAAPTGKAAARMQQALDVDDTVGEAIAAEASTIHRLLGVGRDGGFRHHAENPLPVDLLVVDEVSMVDLALMTRLIEAIPAEARVVLLGDRDQLASVEPGSVFADMCRGAGGFDDALAAVLSASTGQVIRARECDVLPGACIELTRSYRFGPQSGIGLLSAAVRNGDAGDAFGILEDERFDDVALAPESAHADPGASPLEGLLADYRERIASVADDADPVSVFAAYRRLQVLCAVRGGPRGVEGMNDRVERMLADAGLVDGDDPWYPGRPVMITANDYALGLFNGDLGIVMRWGPRGEARACFLADAGAPRWLHPARLPAHETAWAMTVHKSQGSEFDDVLLVLPDRPSPILTRELLYTAVSRARRRVEIHGQRDVLATAISRRVERRGGLAERLGVAHGS